MGKLYILDEKSDNRWNWNQQKAESGRHSSIEAQRKAEHLFCRYQHRGYTAYTVMPGKPAKLLEGFDPTTEQVVMLPPAGMGKQERPWCYYPFLLVLLGLLGWSVRAPWDLLAERVLGTWLVAQIRSRGVLKSVLTRAEYRQLIKRRYLEVPSPSLETQTYRIADWGSTPIKVYEQGEAVKELHVGPKMYLPDDLVVVMHKLMLEANEAVYWEKAHQVHIPTKEELLWMLPRHLY